MCKLASPRISNLSDKPADDEENESTPPSSPPLIARRSKFDDEEEYDDVRQPRPRISVPESPLTGTRS
jgi:hypothetical protein